VKCDCDDILISFSRPVFVRIDANS